MAKKPQSRSAFLALVALTALIALSALQCNTEKTEEAPVPCPANCVEGEMACSGDLVVLCRDSHWQAWENCAAALATCVFDGAAAYCEPLPEPDGGWDTDTGDTDTSDTDTSDTDTGAAR